MSSRLVPDMTSSGSRPAEGEGPYGAAQLAHDGGGGDAVALDVADDQGEPVGRSR